MRRSALLVGVLGVGLLSGVALAKDPPKKAPIVKKTVKPPPPKKSVVVSAANKKKLAGLYAGFKFGMSKDEVVGMLSKELDEKYEEKIKATSDITQQDKLRREKKVEIGRIAGTYVKFEGKKGGWDTSIIEDEFFHQTGESMLERWENSGGKNQRRFFFFHDGKLYKMFVSLDVSILPEDKKNFETFQGYMSAQYGPGDVSPGFITWKTDEFQVRAVDKLKSYDALGLVIEDTRVLPTLVSLREAKAPPKKETSSVIKAVVDVDGTEKVDVKSNGNAVDAVIKAQGGGKK